MAEAGSLIDKEYLKDHYLEIYLEDAVAQMLSNRQEGNKSPTMKPMKFFKEYFTSVHQGTHILFREFSFVSATPYNRLCVLKALLQIYKPLLYHQEYRFDAREYHAIVKLVFPDFHMQVVQDAFTAYDDDKKDEENRIKFIDFVRAMKDSFCTGEFDVEATIIHNQLEDKIDEFSSIPAQSGETSRNLTEADFLNMEDDTLGKQWAFASKILDGSEFKRILNLNDSNSVSSDEPVSGGKLSRSSSESKEASKSEKTGKKKGGTKGKTRGRLAGKHLSNSLNLLQSAKGDDAKKGKRRHRSKSAVAAQRTQKKPWR